VHLQDKVALGAVTGVAASLPGLLFNLFSVLLGTTEHYSFQLSAGVFLREDLLSTAGGLVLGGILWELTSAFLGVLIVYVLHFTGKEFWWLKGPLTSIPFTYILFFGFVFDIHPTHVVPRDLGSNFSLLGENIVFGLAAAYLAARWMGPSRDPDKPELK
jgi:hypothetical protein